MDDPAPTPERADFETFLKVAHVLNSSLDLDAVLRELLSGLEQLLRPTHWSLLLVDETSGELIFTLARGDAASSLHGRRLAAGEGIAGWVAANDAPLLLPDVARDRRFSVRMDELSGFQTRSIVAVPLRADGRCIGVLEIINAMDDRPFTEADARILSGYADFAALAIRNARTHSAVVELTRTDLLTGLRNSQYFLTCVEEAIVRAHRFVLVFFDMDRFKTLVDTQGHVSGSAALAEVGTVLQQTLRADEVACRFGGDEFALMLPAHDVGSGSARCTELASAIAAHTFLRERGLAVRLSASFGVAAFPDDGTTAATLLHEADARMYAAKRARKLARP